MIASSSSTRRKRSAENRYAAKIRAEVMDVRDSYCRVACKGAGPCDGVMEWAHLGDKRRCFTRGMAPELRHCTSWTMKMCSQHHRLYDAHAFEVEYQSPAGANGLIRVSTSQGVVDERRLP